MTIGKRVLYSGRVQGVGFRYTANEIARDFPVAGFVRNLPNGQVELVAEGSPQDVQAFLDAVAERMKRYISDQVIADVPDSNAREFTVRL